VGTWQSAAALNNAEWCLQYATYLDLAKSKLLTPTNYYLDIVGG
jgi:hypothetical protein